MKTKVTKQLKIVPIILILLIMYIYALAIDNVPNNMVVFEGETISVNTLLGFTLNVKNDEGTIETSSNAGEQQLSQTGKKELSLNLFDNIEIKKVDVDVIPKTKVIPVGSIAGLKLYTNGVLVVGMSEIEGTDNKKYKPYENSGIVEGDSIISVNDTNVTSTDELTRKVNNSRGKPVDIKYVHDEETKECSITPVEISRNDYKLGLWVRDSAAGVGTVTFYDPTSKTFGALGHGITDIDTDQLINISSGQFVTSNILNVTKGESGSPGKVQGTIENGNDIGQIYKNTKFGVYGKVDNVSSLNIDTSKEMEVALREDIQEGNATILCNLDNQNVKEYQIEIEKIYRENNYDNKSMKIKVIDPELLEKTGGIIQGMSGAPIIQNGKFVGAVTNVLVSNPQEGYGIFGDMMIKQVKEVN